MGALAALHSQDCLGGSLPCHQTLMYSHMKPGRNADHNPNPNPTPNSTKINRRKRSPGKKKNNSNNNKHTMADNFPGKNLVMGQVKILKRGEELTALKNPVDEKKAGDSDDWVLSSTDRLGPEPEMVPKQMRLGDYYAGSEVISSPPPSSLPFPAFFTKKIVLDSIDDGATDLWRVLRL